MLLAGEMLRNFDSTVTPDVLDPTYQCGSGRAGRCFSRTTGAGGNATWLWGRRRLAGAIWTMAEQYI